MKCTIGIDVGAVSATAVVLVGDESFLINHESLKPLELATGQRAYLSEYRRTRGKPLAAACALLQQILPIVGVENISAVCLTGSGARLATSHLNTHHVNEFKAVALGLEALGYSSCTVFEMGGESSKYLLLQENEDQSLGIVDYSTNGDCAAGTGSFIDQQAGRLRFGIEEVGPLVLQAERSAQIAGRCSVFAKSDMIHAQQKGYSPAEVLRGLCDAVARNFRTAVVRSHKIEGPVVFLGGVAMNEAVVQAMKEAFELDDQQMIIPEPRAHVPAIGAAVAAASMDAKPVCLDHLQKVQEANDSADSKFPTTAPLKMDNVLLLRDQIKAYEPEGSDNPIDVYMGIDIGSVSTNVVAIDANGRVVVEIYTRTMGRPIEVVTDALSQIADHWGDRLRIRGVGTTGSGRELIGELVGADTINDEITAHKTGSTFVGKTMLDGRLPDTIFEIGGQDAKYISLQEGIVVDFTMNDACAAGTGSFLEERAEELDISIKGEFAQLALSSKTPVRLGERCTVFMERDVTSYMQRGATKADLVAGLAYSVVYNYINRVVRGRKIGQCIFFQGGTAYNDAVAAAFAEVTGQQIIVPPHNGVIGAIGAALLAKEKMAPKASADQSSTAQDNGNGEYVSDLKKALSAEQKTRFRGYALTEVDYTLREFTCKSCSNACQIQEFEVEGNKTYWGDKCSEKFRKQVKSAAEPVIEDLMAMRERLLLDDPDLPDVGQNARTVGIPATMFAMEQMPFWRTLLTHMGFRTVLSEPTNKKVVQAGLSAVVAEPCFPIIVAHGHVRNLDRGDVDYILMPNIISLETKQTETESHLCPWHQTLPFVCRQAPVLQNCARKFLTPQIRFDEGQGFVAKTLVKFFGELGISKRCVTEATNAAYKAQQRFNAEMVQAGREALETLKRTGQPGVLLVGRPYNIHDAGMNLSVGYKLRKFYGVNCIPMDALPLDEMPITDTNDNMYWTLGQRILAAAKLVKEWSNLHIIYITNFKCGPDSFIKHFVHKASGKPFLTLQFDGHSNDAGMMTRCEAYLDSKGILRPWRFQDHSTQPVTTGS